MSNLTPKQRLLNVLNRKPVDRPPVICPGGMMNAAIVEVMTASGYTLPEGHSDPELMAKLAAAVQQQTGFENLGVPFCMTVEAEVLGSPVDYGTLKCEPKVTQELFPNAAAVVPEDITALLTTGRINTVAAATKILAETYPDLPVTGSLTGPISTAASLVDPVPFLKDLRRNPAAAHQTLSYVTDFLIAFAHRLIDNGAAVIALGDPTATGEILGPKAFGEYAVPYINRLIDAVHARQVPVILHICGNMNTVKHLLPELKADAISTDAVVSLRKLKEEYPNILIMGNLSTFLLEFGPAEKVAVNARRLLADGIDIIAPACGLSTSTSLFHIRAMTDTIRNKGV
ncbi:MAG TPA: uroporphyrinogen decarboxylase family protein [Patescibacteria group bacterium]|nr:uroporphyrinogen decarboxylase family protein [Patescibacteria group bacterium]